MINLNFTSMVTKTAVHYLLTYKYVAHSRSSLAVLMWLTHL